MIAIVDYGVGNLGSIVNMFRRADVDAALVREPAGIDGAARVVLPGVGAFDACAAALDASGLRPAVERAALIDAKPVLGVCVGMQLLGEGSDEGELAGLGWIPGRAQRLRSVGDPAVKVPHMGWSEIDVRDQEPVLPAEVDGRRSRFYFLHSYHLVPASSEHVVATAEHGERFVCAVRRDNILGVQFHPEKSHRFGLELFRRFAAL